MQATEECTPSIAMVPSTFSRSYGITSMTPLQEQKAQLRSEMRTRRAALAPKNQNIFKDLANNFIAQVKLEPGTVVSVYNAFRDEMDCLFLIEALRMREHKIALPRVTGKGLPLQFHLFEPGDPLTVNTMGMLEPRDSAPLADPNAVLTPLLAFDRAHNRLGYGGGFYDRTLAALRARKPIIAIGIGYAFQEIPLVPIGINDIALDLIATEVNIF
jgi:5-formyltetrahydrofolate cyclo-ligase